MQTSASQCNGWACRLLVGTSTSCPGKLDLLGKRKGQVSPGPRSLPTLTYKASRLLFPHLSTVLQTPWGTLLHGYPSLIALGSHFIAWSQRL